MAGLPGALCTATQAFQRQLTLDCPTLLSACIQRSWPLASELLHMIRSWAWCLQPAVSRHRSQQLEAVHAGEPSARSPAGMAQPPSASQWQHAGSRLVLTGMR